MLKQEGYELIGAAFEVYNELGFGLLEEIYQQALEFELETRNIPFDSKRELKVYYKQRKLDKVYIPDLFVYNGIIAELKAVKELNDEHRAQLMNYMRITNTKVGYLINFGKSEQLDWERFII
ncbi:MAG: GxxExxY protein [Victivallaceae bacterium]|nr:GxxExxY protein [Victivallaceae bacterium]